MTKSALSQLAVNRDSWPTLARILTKTLPEDLASRQQQHLSPEEFIAIVMDHIPDEYTSVVENRLPLFLAPPLEGCDTPQLAAAAQQQQQPGSGDADERVQSYLADLDALLHHLSETKLYSVIKQSLSLKRKVQARDKKLELAAAAITAEEESMEAAALAASLANSTAINGARSDSISRRASIMRRGSWKGGMAQLRDVKEDEVKDAVPAGDPLCHRADGCTLPPNLRRLSHAQSSAMSLMNMHPPEHRVNDLTAFMTMFLFAVFEYWPEIWKGVNIPGLEEVVIPPRKTSQLAGGVSIAEEINFLKGQIEALMELVGDLKAPDDV